MREFYFSIVVLLIAQVAYGQQYPDRHNTSINSSWISCETKINPNPIRGESHWIQYELDTYYELGASTIWNLNAYGQTENGVSDVVIDYSLDGVNWTEWGSYALDRAEALSTYEGEEGPDFQGLLARYLLITSIANYGGECHGFSEFRVESKSVQISSVTNNELQISVNAQPNPFSNETKILLNDLPNGALTYQMQDALGRILQKGEVTGSQVIISGEELAAGIYTVTFYHNTGTKSIQLTRIK